MCVSLSQYSRVSRMVPVLHLLSSAVAFHMNFNLIYGAKKQSIIDNGFFFFNFIHVIAWLGWTTDVVNRINIFF